jgi:beta-lactamase regulating signal transducer with metallopeptidase domain
VDALLDLGLRNALGATVLAVLVAGLGRVCRRPALRHSLWLLVLLRLLVPPVLPLRLLPAPAQSPPHADASVVPEGPAAVAAEDAAEPVPAEAPVAEPDAPDVTVLPETASSRALPSWKPVVLTLWVAGSILWCALAGLRLARFRRLLRYAEPAPAPLQDRAGRLAARLGLARCPGVWLVPAPVSPMLWALGTAPRLLLPMALWERLGPEQQDTLLLHELAHLRRRDHWVRRLELLVLGLYWWHPVVWWARRELREAEEACCDAWVVWALPAAARAYATALLETVTFLSQSRPALPAAASGAGHVQLLKRRLTMILCGAPSRTLTWGGLLVVLAAAALLLPLWPTWAEPPRTARPEPERGEPEGKPAGTPAAGLAKQTGGEDRSHTERVLDLQDEIELLEVQIDVKKAELRAAEAALSGAKARLEQERRSDYGTGQSVTAEGDVAKLEAQLRVKQAELREPEVRLKQVRRRLEQQLRHHTETAPAEPRPASRAEEWFDEVLKDFGTVQRGPTLRHTFRLTNTTKDTIHVSGVRVTCGCLTAVPSPTELAPGQKGSVLVTLDTRRFSGPKTVRVFVEFDRPRADEVVLMVRANSRDAEEPDTQKRLQDLERKLNDLLREIDALKRQMGPQQSGGMGEVQPRVVVLPRDSRNLHIPVAVDLGKNARATNLILFVSTDQGGTWRQAATIPVDQDQFTFNASHDGEYWFKVAVVTNTGKAEPPRLSDTSPLLKVIVRTE